MSCGISQVPRTKPRPLATVARAGRWGRGRSQAGGGSRVTLSTCVGVPPPRGKPWRARERVKPQPRRQAGRLAPALPRSLRRALRGWPPPASVAHASTKGNAVGKDPLSSRGCGLWHPQRGPEGPPAAACLPVLRAPSKGATRVGESPRRPAGWPGAAPRAEPAVGEIRDCMGEIWAVRTAPLFLARTGPGRPHPVHSRPPIPA
ncbi:uncharacterized protein LOC130684755 [Manis pentadactyla]|uniref:uncharacterized protein LOC130684755 n=1 Tax=Manis pentadactyla TaxID=143292 RepID=UPI00255CEEFB|nr:uncharacterized protein LOC130684755 [Manis pentadactyla]